MKHTKHFAVLVFLLGCGPSVVESPWMEPAVVVFVQGVPLDQYSKDPALFFAIQLHAVQVPADTTFWKVEAYPGGLLKQDTTAPGLRAGHRWYVERGAVVTLRFTAWGPKVGPRALEWSNP